MLNKIKVFTIIILVTTLASLSVLCQKKVIHPIKPHDFSGLGLTQEFKVLTEGANAKIDKPFIFVAQNQSSYSQLQKLVENLPEFSTIDFSHSQVIAIFAGEKNTGGYDLKIKKQSAKLLVEIIPPAKDMMVTQAITTPYKVFQVPMVANEHLQFELPKNFDQNAEVFRVSQSGFKFTGGIAGISKSFKADGTVRLLTFGENATLILELRGKSQESKRKFFAVGSGISRNGEIKISQINSGSFVESPNPGMNISGIRKGKTLSLKFVSLDPNTADGYLGSGNLKAVLIK